ncbi:nucleotidyltransferase domain-containing protein [Kutzneria buriramensis]|uniref:Nucleotidyltransferase-like protein n=1 Tax=Kutzneria buriramensis TaxID=1045776 RepID=A0A3E0HGN0_9PSEU|nr:nucleotidyltransferase domain-containing protein [Kutzneria buriramensis]REH44965.1 nucleotidyltransferase-like protein [Kutzneria buriramensis]
MGVTEFGERLAALGWVTDLMVAGSLATGDYVPGISDIDLVALTDGPVGADLQAALTEIHLAEDPALKLGCVYVNAAQVSDVALKHPTWTHQRLIQRILSGVNRAELVRHGYAVFGREPRDVMPPMSDDDVREAGRAELTGYWAWAVWRPRLWLDPEFADLSLTSMARGRHAIATGTLLTKSAAIEQAAAPAWLIEQLRARRGGNPATSPRLRTAVIAWLDAQRTTRRAAAN